jgi:hypothetical protein
VEGAIDLERRERNSNKLQLRWPRRQFELIANPDPSRGIAHITTCNIQQLATQLPTRFFLIASRFVCRASPVRSHLRSLAVVQQVSVMGLPSASGSCRC